MNSRIDQLVRTLLQKDKLDQCSLSELKDYAERHPYFGAAQLLLTKKLQEQNDSAFDQQLQKTLLFFNNPLWVEHLLSENSVVEFRPKAQEMVFEPFHTVDYFASQGIKLREDEKPTDKFGKQLKSFTEWLRTMKRLPVTELATQVAPVTEKKVEEMAEISLKEPEVVTEAMAEVWEKQKNHSRAIDIYRKLSLLEPAKSAYFAGKIEELKK